MTTATGNLDQAEVDRFNRLASEWWDPSGKFKPLHKIGPARIGFIRDQVVAHFHRDRLEIRVLDGLGVLDIGCGGGLISEPMAQLGGRVTGIDPGKVNIEIAKSHAEREGLTIDYRVARAEDLVAAGEVFEVVVCLEVIEHVPVVPAFTRTICRLVKPGGLLVVSTINRTMKAFALAIVGAEYVLRWLPRGTHQWDRFVRPDELSREVRANGLAVGAVTGMVFNPLKDEWLLASDTDVNYLMAAHRPA